MTMRRGSMSAERPRGRARLEGRETGCKSRKDCDMMSATPQSRFALVALGAKSFASYFHLVLCLWSLDVSGAASCAAPLTRHIRDPGSTLFSACFIFTLILGTRLSYMLA